MFAAAKVIHLFEFTKFFAVFFQLTAVTRASATPQYLQKLPSGIPQDCRKDCCYQYVLGIYRHHAYVAVSVFQLSEQHLVDGLYAASLLAYVAPYVLAYIIYIIKEVAESVQQLVGLRLIFRRVGVRQYLDA